MMPVTRVQHIVRTLTCVLERDVMQLYMHNDQVESAKEADLDAQRPRPVRSICSMCVCCSILDIIRVKVITFMNVQAWSLRADSIRPTVAA